MRGGIKIKPEAIIKIVINLLFLMKLLGDNLVMYVKRINKPPTKIKNKSIENHDTNIIIFVKAQTNKAWMIVSSIRRLGVDLKRIFKELSTIKVEMMALISKALKIV